MAKFMSMPVRICLAATVVGSFVAGCQPIADPNAEPPRMPTPPAKKAFNVNDIPAGMPVAMADNRALRTAIQTTAVSPRPDPFALREIEIGYELKQEGFRVFSQTGGFFPSMFTPIPERIEVERIEPQPYRRLAGVLVGDSILAIIDMGGGNMQIVRPGQQIPNSPWRVVSIDEEKALLRRSGNVLPKEVIVRLESRP